MAIDIWGWHCFRGGGILSSTASPPGDENSANLIGFGGMTLLRTTFSLRIQWEIDSVIGAGALDFPNFGVAVGLLAASDPGQLGPAQQNQADFLVRTQVDWGLPEQVSTVTDTFLWRYYGRSMPNWVDADGMRRLPSEVSDWRIWVAIDTLDDISLKTFPESAVYEHTTWTLWGTTT